jgi:hypothetical protein
MAPITNSVDSSSSDKRQDEHTPTTAAFPVHTASGSNKTRTLLVHQKSPLLITTPPQVTRALAFSHPFLLPLSHFFGLLSWTSGDPWESFLMVALFWTIVLYGDPITRWAGPVVTILALIAAMYSRRYSPLSTKSTVDVSKGHNREGSEETFKHQKSLDEIVDSLNIFTSRCNILAEPFLQFTDFLSTQITPTTATTRPALTSMLLRILMILPIWIGLTLPPLRLVTTQRVVLIIGTIALTWHSRPARISRNLLWRSLAIRRAFSTITGLEFTMAISETVPPLPPRKETQHSTASSLATRSRGSSAGVRFTFVLYENQRRWLGLGWTSSMFAYERAAWTDEHLNASPPKEKFKLPKVEGGHSVWRWVPGSEWKIEGPGKGSISTPDKAKSEGWIYYDNKVCDIVL